MYPEHLDQITDAQAKLLCDQLRADIVNSVAKTGGHLASSLGAVEITMAIHRVFDLDSDRLVFDVGHQCYAHKFLTGRGKEMASLRKLGGLSGFPKPKEHRADAFIAGHASNSVSVALGMARARTLNREDYSVLALIGDGAMTGGLSYEGLSDAGQSGERIIVILNDNGMSITKNVGGVASHLAKQRLKPQYLQFKKFYRRITGGNPVGRALYRFTHKVKQGIKSAVLHCSMFEDMGFTYLGPVDGHDVAYLTRLLRYAKELNGPVLLHIKTVKGKGYTPAEKEPDRFHGVGPFHVEDGSPVTSNDHPTFSSVFGETMCRLASEREDVCAITAAMPDGVGLTEFARQYPERFFDVGIAEGHAVSMAAGMAKQRAIPVAAIYSTFLQRSYDMLLHDVAIQNLHVVLAVDRAGLVGEDSETHQGVFDVAYLTSIPGMKIYCPASFEELRAMLRYAVTKCRGPVAVRYPRGGEGAYTSMSGIEGVSILGQGRDHRRLWNDGQRGADRRPPAGGSGCLGPGAEAEQHFSAGCGRPEGLRQADRAVDRGGGVRGRRLRRPPYRLRADSEGPGRPVRGAGEPGGPVHPARIGGRVAAALWHRRGVHREKGRGGDLPWLKSGWTYCWWSGGSSTVGRGPRPSSWRGRFIPADAAATRPVWPWMRTRPWRSGGRA